MSKSLKSPPRFDPDEDNYEQFKKDLQIWGLLTDLEAKKRGPAVYLSLDKKAREAVRSLTVAQINADDGLAKITERLDEVYLQDQNTRAYMAFQNFYRCKRESGETFEKFIIRFEGLYNDLVEHQLQLPEGIKAFFVLNAANLSDDMEKLARATASQLTYTCMKDQIKKICGTSVSNQQDEAASAPLIKDEVLFGYGNKGRGSRGSNRGRGGKSSRGARGGASKHDGETTNPTNSYGVVMRCYGCDSTLHMFKDCPKNPEKSAAQNLPKKSEPKKDTEEVHVVLLNAKPDSKQRGLVFETLGKGLLDSGCTRTVAGKFWMDEFLSTIPPAEKSKISELPSDAKFRFGDGVESASLKKLIIPIKIGSRKHLLSVDVVKNEIPLLISKPTIKKIGCKESNMQFKNDRWIIDGEVVQLQLTSSRHYCVPLSVFHCEGNCNFTFTIQDLQKLPKAEKKKKAVKLHRQFGHASELKLTKLIQDSKIEDKEFIECIKEVCNECEICKEYQAAPPRPAVSLPLATKFNEVVCLDLKEYVHNKVWILHMIDAATRYSQAKLIKTKRKEEIVGKIFEMWISSFGVPGTLMCDNGGEFVNELYTEASQKLGLRMVMSPAESPFSNGIVERHHKVLHDTMLKTKVDANCEPEVALAWACSAKNALQNKNGFSPNQLVFGQNVNLPNVLVDDLPALSTTTASELIRKNLQALHDARKNYLQAENSDRIRKALRQKTRTHTEEKYESGDKVYFKRNKYKGWLGPATVLGSDKYVVLVKLGGSVYKCHRCHIQKLKSVGSANDISQNNAVSQGASSQKKSVESAFLEEEFSSESDEEITGAGVNDSATVVSDENATGVNEDATGAGVNQCTTDVAGEETGTAGTDVIATDTGVNQCATEVAAEEAGV